MKQKYIFLVVGLLFSIYGRSQNNYEVSQIPFQTYSVYNEYYVETDDDKFSDYIPLGFEFSFFGNIYNQILVSTNGYVAFDGVPNIFSPWNFTTTIPDTAFPVKNAILACYHDMDNSNGAGQITCATIGNYPYRKFILLFNNQPHYSCTTLQSTFQMIVYETFNIIDVQIINKPACVTWNSGNTVIGIINTAGDIAFTPTNRNTGGWTASQEGYRFKLPLASNIYHYTKCNENTGTFDVYDLTVAQNDINEVNPSSVLFYETLEDAQNNTNSLQNLNYSSIQFAQTIYAFSEGIIYDVKLQVIDCFEDFDSDSIPTVNEDLNGDGNLANDDTDNDGIPNFADNDDDGDTVLTEYEYVFPRNSQSFTGPLDTDSDLIPDYLDDDDDNDGVLTKDEDYNGNFNPQDDDINTNSIPDYLDDTAVLGINSFENEAQFTLYPNPAFSEINVESNALTLVKEIEIYTINGQVLKKVVANAIAVKVDISEFQSGIYFIKVTTDKGNLTKKFLKK